MSSASEPPFPARRARSDWLADAVIFAGCGFLGLVALGLAQEHDAMPTWLEAIDPLLGLVACLALWWRRRFPLAVALLAIPLLALASSALPAGLVIVLSLALRVPWQRALQLLGLYVVTVVSVEVLLVGGEDSWTNVALALATLLAAFAWGSAMRNRRLLFQRLRADAERERADHARRLADARRAEREAIAREMHDVLAHRVSLLSGHAGALAYRTRRAEEGAGPGLSGAEVAESAEIIRGNAHAAVDELQEVLHLLRAESDVAEPTSLLPRIEDIDDLVAAAAAAGQEIVFRSELDAGATGDLRPQLHRTAYRTVQEGLTNARKHAPGIPVTVCLTGAPGSGLTVQVTNPTAVGPSAGIPGIGAGLSGLAERVRLDGGILEHASVDGAFRLRARLPWPAR
ncbi:histidine kinase [Streptomyces sp. NPDC002896]|uniref:sensor histidine kinase n=1 Tax=Streptomyces sp. NPDC002896 TaxID=3154438 RepID=UPI00331B8DFD